MRKCVFRKFVKNEEFQTSFGIKHVPVYEDSEPGLFHGWGCDGKELETGAVTCTVAIIEMPDGRIEAPAAMFVRFLDAPPTE